MNNEKWFEMIRLSKELGIEKLAEIDSIVKIARKFMQFMEMTVRESPKFKAGDEVVFKKPENYDVKRQSYENNLTPHGTYGKVVDLVTTNGVHNGEYWVKWAPGSTPGNGIWKCRGEFLAKYEYVDEIELRYKGDEL